MVTELCDSSREVQANPLSRARRPFWLWPHLLSLDAPFVALLWQELFAEATGVSLRPAARVLLGLAVWVVYLLDRVFDSLRPHAPLTARHEFYRKHRKAAVTVATLAMIAALGMCHFLQPIVLHGGELVTLAIGLYLMAVHLLPRPSRLRLPKEIVVGVIFAIGTALAPVLHSRAWRQMLPPVLLFALLCLLNCAVIEHWEWQGGRASALSRRPQLWLGWVARNLEWLSLLFACAGLCLALWHAPRDLYAALTISAFTIVLFERRRPALSLDAMRTLADVPLLVPVLLLLVAHYR